MASTRVESVRLILVFHDPVGCEDEGAYGPEARRILCRFGEAENTLLMKHIVHEELDRDFFGLAVDDLTPLCQELYALREATCAHRAS